MRKILVIGDDPRFQKILNHQLSGTGWPVESAEISCEMTLETAGNDVALVVADINVPVPRAFLVLALLRTRLPGVPILVLSAFSSKENVAAAYRYGASDFIEKPYEADLLRERIAGLLGSFRECESL